MTPTRHYVVVEHPAGFNPWDNNPALIKLMAAVITSVTHAEPGALKAAYPLDARLSIRSTDSLHPQAR